MKLSDEQMLKYLARRETDLIDCKAAFESQDLKVLERIGHQMKGNGATFGFDELSSIGALLEQGARSQDWIKIEQSIQELQTFLRQKNPSQTSLK